MNIKTETMLINLKTIINQIATILEDSNNLSTVALLLSSAQLQVSILKYEQSKSEK